jgi:hypothetical protein
MRSGGTDPQIPDLRTRWLYVVGFNAEEGPGTR